VGCLDLDALAGERLQALCGAMQRVALGHAGSVTLQRRDRTVGPGRRRPSRDVALGG
jgi:hypothetical protein